MLPVMLLKEPGSFKIIHINLCDLDFLFASKLKWSFGKLVLVITKIEKEGRGREANRPRWLFDSVSFRTFPKFVKQPWQLGEWSGKYAQKLVGGGEEILRLQVICPLVLLDYWENEACTKESDCHGIFSYAVWVPSWYDELKTLCVINREGER